MDGSVSVAEVYQAMLAAMEAPGFLPLVQTASQFLGAPVVLTDDGYHLVAQYPPEKIGDPAYDTLLEKASLPIGIIDDFRKAYLENQGKFYEPFYSDAGPAAACPRILAEIHTSQKILGHVGILTGRTPIQPWHWEITNIFLAVLRIKMNLSTQPVITLSNSLTTLLDPQAGRQARELAILQLAELKHHPALLIVGPLNTTAGHQAFLSVIISHIQQKFRNTILTVFDNDLVILLTSPNPTSQPASHATSSGKSMAQTAARLAALLYQYQITCGMVEPIADLLRMPDYYWQARLTALVSADSADPGSLHAFQDLAPAQLYRQIIDSGRARCFVHPLLDALSAYDQENRTEFCETLEQYCLSLFDRNRTAAALHIHRNTLFYRLRRIEELFSVDLDEPRLLHHLLVSFQLRNGERRI